MVCNDFVYLINLLTLIILFERVMNEIGIMLKVRETHQFHKIK